MSFLSKLFGKGDEPRCPALAILRRIALHCGPRPRLRHLRTQFGRQGLHHPAMAKQSEVTTGQMRSNMPTGESSLFHAFAYGLDVSEFPSYKVLRFIDLT